MYIKIASDLVRWYLRNSPITEGKKQLLAATHSFIIPHQNSLTAKMKHDFFMKLNLSNKEHLRMWLYGEHDERYEIHWLNKILRPGDVAWDIGANIGFYTCYFAKLVTPTGKVFAFEPAQQTFTYLKTQIEINQFENIQALPMGLGAKQETVALHYNHSASGEGTASIKYIAGKSNKESINIDTIDNLVATQQIEKADFVKIDVEGYQKEVIDGGQDFFQNNDPLVLAELKDENKADMQMIADHIVELGYSMYEIHKKGLKICASLIDSKKRNFILVKKDAQNFQRIAPFLLD